MSYIFSPKRISEKVSGKKSKWKKTPDHSYFGKLRTRLGTKNIADIFNGINQHLREGGNYPSN